MSEHTPTPWHVNDDRPFDDTSRLSISNGDARIIANIVTRETTHGFEGGSANAAFIVKAVYNHEKLLEFFKWAMREGPWDGGDLDGGSVQDKAETLGLIVKTQYDAEKHGVQSDFETGDDWFEYAPDLRVPLIARGNT